MFYLLNGDITFDMITQAWARALCFWSSLAEIVVQWEKVLKQLTRFPKYVSQYMETLGHKLYMYGFHGVNQKSSASF